MPGNFSDPPTSPASTADGSPQYQHKTYGGSASGDRRVGVYTLRVEQPDSSSSSRDRELAQIQDACLHNAGVCAALGEIGKSQTWELLAKATESGFSTSHTTYDGWGGIGGDALSFELVGNVFNYYEWLGDVQMLATMVCLLRPTSQDAGKENVSKTSKPWSLLPKGQDDKFDMYIRRYADLLYSWGMLTTRAELNKHLVLIPNPSEGGMVAAGQSNENRVIPSIAFCFTCPICSKETIPGKNFCSTCQDYAFRCIICDTAVRGLFTACET